MKKLIYTGMLGMLLLGFSSCLKDNKFLDVSNTQPIIEFSRGSNGTKTLSWGTLDTAVVDTAIAIDIASPQVLNYDVTVKINYDQSLITQWNAANPDNMLQVLPDSDGVIPASPITVTIPKGFRIGKIPIKLYADKIDPTVSYAMPFTITSASGAGSNQNLIVSSNAGKLMYAFIGNPIAGSYSQEYIRYNTATQTPPPATDATSPGVLVPVTPLQVRATSGIGVDYLISFTNTAGVLSDFKVTMDAATVTAAGITISVPPTIVADPVAGKYTLNFQYLNSANAARNITDIFTK